MIDHGKHVFRPCRGSKRDGDSFSIPRLPPAHGGSKETVGHTLSALTGLSALTITFLTNRDHPRKADVVSKVIGDFSENHATYAKAFPRFLETLNRPQHASKTG